MYVIMGDLNGKSDKNKQLDFLQRAVKKGRMTTVRATCLFHAGSESDLRCPSFRISLSFCSVHKNFGPLSSPSSNF